jgi:hypothetical protein
VREGGQRIRGEPVVHTEAESSELGAQAAAEEALQGSARQDTGVISEPSETHYAHNTTRQDT